MIKQLFLLCLVLVSNNMLAQDKVQIGLINYRGPDNNVGVDFANSVQEEILSLLQYRYQVSFNKYFGANLQQNFSTAYQVNDIVICLGTESSGFAISQDNYPKPTIASIVLDPQLQGVNKSTDGTSGVPNFTYLESPFNIPRDLEMLHAIYPFDRLLVIAENNAIGGAPFVEKLFESYLQAKDINVVALDYGTDLSSYQNDNEGDNKTAAYILPNLERDSATINDNFASLKAARIPSAALFGEDYLDAGALMAYETDDNLEKMPRRIALNVMKILEGTLAQDIPVEMQTFAENLLLNMETARNIEIYPNFDIMAEATLKNLERIPEDNKLSLQQAVFEALQRNLDIRIAGADVSISETEVGIAKADLLPQLDASSSLSFVDDITALSYQGAQGQTNWLFSGQLSQLILAEPALANLAIQKMLMQTEEQALKQTQLDVIIDVANAYINILLAKSNLNIQQENVARNKENFDIATAKEKIGYTGATDINRWEAELANANIGLNNAYAGLRQAKFQLNQLLNRPINQAVNIQDLSMEESMILIADRRIDLVDNYGQLEMFSNFLVDFAMQRLPELAQIDLGLDVQKRLQLSRQRAFYLPSVGLNGSYNQILGKYRVPEMFTPLDNVATWSVNIGVSLPIFQGNSRKKLLEQSRLNVLQLEDSKKNLENQLELRIRANLENVGASFSAMELSQQAADASRKNFEIIQNAYSAGQANVTTLIDAQNNALQTELSSINAVYSFILDFLLLERSIGFYNFLATTSERDAFFQSVTQYFLNRPDNR